MQFYPRFDEAVFAYDVVMAQATVFWRRRVSDSVGLFDETLRYSGDFEYWLRAATAGFRFTNVREALALIVLHEAALSTRYADEVESETRAVRERYRTSITPRSRRLSRFAHLARWRRSQLMLRVNFARKRPSDWREIIPVLQAAGVRMKFKDSLHLLAPTPLPKSWSFWSADATHVEDHIDRLLRSSAMSRPR